MDTVPAQRVEPAIPSSPIMVPIPHVEARSDKFYSQDGTYLKDKPSDKPAVTRPVVADSHVPWSAEVSGYAPPCTGFPLQEWACGELASPFSDDTRREKVLNPGGRTGLVGGWGRFAARGPNQSVDPIITRFKPDGARGSATGPGENRTLQMLAVLRRDCHEWSVPGAMIRTDKTGRTETETEAMIRGLTSKGVGETIARRISLGSSHPAKKMATAGVLSSGSGWEVYRGYTDDARNTDDAWIETTVRHYHLAVDRGSEVQDPHLGVKWVDISGTGEVRASASTLPMWRCCSSPDSPQRPLPLAGQRLQATPLLGELCGRQAAGRAANRAASA